MSLLFFRKFYRKKWRKPQTIQNNGTCENFGERNKEAGAWQT